MIGYELAKTTYFLWKFYSRHPRNVLTVFDFIKIPWNWCVAEEEAFIFNWPERIVPISTMCLTRFMVILGLTCPSKITIIRSHIKFLNFGIHGHRLSLDLYSFFGPPQLHINACTISFNYPQTLCANQRRKIRRYLVIKLSCQFNVSAIWSVCQTS